MAKNSTKIGTNLKFIGGVNKDRIGGNCSIIEHTDETGNTTRVMFDLGTMFTPYDSGFNSAIPNITEYFPHKDAKTGNITPASKPVSALFLTHAHEDHIGALIDYTRMGYVLPPIKTSRFSRALIRLAFKQEGLEAPEIEAVKNQENIQIGENIMVEPFTVSHSIIGAVGFHTLTFVDDKPYAGIINNGDFLTEENMPVGDSFSLAEYQDLMSRKLTTHILLDSTSTRPNGSKRIGFEQAVSNTLKVIQDNPDRNIIISPVISRSPQNIAIDMEVARRLKTKVCLDGKWLELVHQAMLMSGYHDFDDVVYKGKLDKFMQDKHISKKYIADTGALAQGLEEYYKNQSDTTYIPMSSAIKMALDLHKDIKLDNKVLGLFRQRIIDDINGKTGPQMLQLWASKGAKIVITPCGRKISNFEEVQMQDSGHINVEAMGKLMDTVQKTSPNVIIIPIHGNPQQCQDTANIAEQHNLKSYLASNMRVLSLAQGEVQNIEDSIPMTWIGVKKVYFNPLEPDSSIPLEGRTEYWHITDDYEVISKISEANNVRVRKPGDKDYKVSQGQMFDDKYEDSIIHENMKEKIYSGKTFSRKEKGDKEARAKKIEAKIARKQRQQAEKTARKLARNSKSFGKDDFSL